MYVGWSGIGGIRKQPTLTTDLLSARPTDTQPTFFRRTTGTIPRGSQDETVVSTGDDETMEEQSETTMDQTQGTFMAGTAESTVNGTRT